MFCEMLLDEIHALYILGLAELWKIDQHLKHLITVCQTAGKLFTQMGFLLLWHMAFCKGYNNSSYKIFDIWTLKEFISDVCGYGEICFLAGQWNIVFLLNSFPLSLVLMHCKNSRFTMSSVYIHCCARFAMNCLTSVTETNAYKMLKWSLNMYWLFVKWNKSVHTHFQVSPMFVDGWFIVRNQVL